MLVTRSGGGIPLIIDGNAGAWCAPSGVGAVRFPISAIVYADGGVIVPFTCFNVNVFAFTQYVDDPAVGDLSNRSNTSVDNGVGVDTGGHGEEHDDGPSRLLQFSWAFGNPAFPIIVTANLTPRGEPLLPDPRYVGLH